ncbi:peptide-methionine (R)-S-oxide reductase MsrB [Stenomitos frigidus]|uniref:peptide-methionine (R)-S-oxide reductase n=1 Tax=Stenomitos frigidus ULC18 TaxID=2107698 RepID=A0A2T1DST6_9CYAN|nr:peptide-methionine (R)-S-oxide reductase MsrB [Stenomitos frigidus]PSB23576.1 peptide-methionine (R)-S-oxide reductase [Stenomitos frigidus ULC18]
MKKRYFLWAGTAMIGTAGLSRYFPGRARAEMTTTHAQTTNNGFEITKPEPEWRKILTSEQFQVLRQQGTELPGTSPLNQQHDKGTFACAACALPLFTSTAKFDSGTGWPSFYAPIEGAIGTTTDTSFFMTRVEVHCRRCGGHLGHVFDDGPQPTGKRYCMNGVAMKFIPG